MRHESHRPSADRASTWQWTDAAWGAQGDMGVTNSFGLFIHYWVWGWGAMALGLYLLGAWLKETFIHPIAVDWFTYWGLLASGLLFSVVGAHFVLMTPKMKHRVRTIDIADDRVRVVFWWRSRRKDIEFTRDEVEQVRPCKTEKGVIKLLFTGSPRETICYAVKVRNQPLFFVTGIDDSVHEAARRLSGQEPSTLQGAGAGG